MGCPIIGGIVYLLADGVMYLNTHWKRLAIHYFNAQILIRWQYLWNTPLLSLFFVFVSVFAGDSC